MRIAIMGSGGVGAYVGSRLQAGAVDLMVFAVKLASMPYTFRSSMSEDLERGVPTPGHSAVYCGLVLYEGGQPVNFKEAI